MDSVDSVDKSAFYILYVFLPNILLWLGTAYTRICLKLVGGGKSKGSLILE